MKDIYKSIFLENFFSVAGTGTAITMIGLVCAAGIAAIDIGASKYKSTLPPATFNYKYICKCHSDGGDKDMDKEIKKENIIID